MDRGAGPATGLGKLQRVNPEQRLGGVPSYFRGAATAERIMASSTHWITGVDAYLSQSNALVAGLRAMAGEPDYTPRKRHQLVELNLPQFDYVERHLSSVKTATQIVNELIAKER